MTRDSNQATRTAARQEIHRRIAPAAPSTPQAAPGTAAGRITTTRLQAGHQIRVERAGPQAPGIVGPTSRKTKSEPVTVVSNEKVGKRHTVTVRHADGSTSKMDASPSQTQMLHTPENMNKVDVYRENSQRRNAQLQAESSTNNQVKALERERAIIATRSDTYGRNRRAQIDQELSALRKRK